MVNLATLLLLLSTPVCLLLAIPFEIARNLTFDRSIDKVTLSRTNLTKVDQPLGDHYITCYVTPNDDEVPAPVREEFIKDCRYIFHERLALLSYVSQEVEFGNSHYRIPLGMVVPAIWSYGRCTLYVKSPFMEDRDFISLMDVIIMANKILTECVEKGTQWGGVSPIGSMVHFFQLVILGPPLRSGRSNLGEMNQNMS